CLLDPGLDAQSPPGAARPGWRRPGVDAGPFGRRRRRHRGPGRRPALWAMAGPRTFFWLRDGAGVYVVKRPTPAPPCRGHARTGRARSIVLHRAVSRIHLEQAAGRSPSRHRAVDQRFSRADPWWRHPRRRLGDGRSVAHRRRKRGLCVREAMPIVVNLDVMLARRKMRSKELAEQIGITEQNVSLLKSGKVKGVRFDTLARICEALACQPGDILEYRAGNDEILGRAAQA